LRPLYDRSPALLYLYRAVYALWLLLKASYFIPSVGSRRGGRSRDRLSGPGPDRGRDGGWCVSCWPGFAYRIAVEERALAEALGDRYRDHMRRTKAPDPNVL
jgi:protein-S-isoprenylcysteine O-methyltransferase Ste14